MNTPRTSRRASLHEASLYLASHPVLWLLAEVVRRVGPVVSVPPLGAIVNDPDIARAILTDETAFTKTGPGGLSHVITQVMGPVGLLNTDGPAHRALRAKLTDLFTPTTARALTEAAFAASLADLTGRLRRGDTVDLAAETRELTGRMTCQLLGVTPPLGQEATTYRGVYDLSERLAGYVSIRMRPLSDAKLREVHEPFDALMNVARAAYEQPGEPPPPPPFPLRGEGENYDDIPASITARCPHRFSPAPVRRERGEGGEGCPASVIARLKAMGLDFDEVRGVLASLFLVGTQTVAVAVPRIVALLVDTGQWERVRAHRALLPGAIVEGLRLTVPTPVTYRTAVADTTIDGHRFRAGSRALIFTYNTARDAHAFPAPLRFDPARAIPARHRTLPYGAGPHFCLGYALAQAELHAILTALLDAGDVQIVHRAAARRVMLPSYRRLVIQAASREPEAIR